ncbi:MAG TPA: lipopolysaccharide heptosyltransferase I [Burkholderiales bacterium]|nr:lipopolysaccharide heptosyltransferase I [Burkholderiales bacterium]
MPRILLVKTSSLGDVVHNLPVATDIRAAAPSAEIHWVVEQPFAAIPGLHPAVARVIPVAIRRWRTRFLDRAVREEIRAFVSELKRDHYDAVIDTQGLLKSALVAWAARGVRHGLDFTSSREPLAFFYDRTYSIPWTLHAVERNRALAAQALNHAAASAADYGIAAPRAPFAWLPDGAYVVLVHSASARAKLWPEARWVELATRLGERGMRSVLPWGNADERLRAESIARVVQNTVVAPPLPLAEVAPLLAGARTVIGVDTGLSHLAAALKVPTIGIYCATDPASTGLYGSARAINLGGRDLPPQVGDVLAALEKSGV